MEREVGRLEQFWRLRKRIRGSGDYLIVGIDVGKDTHNAFMGTSQGKTLSLKFPLQEKIFKEMDFEEIYKKAKDHHQYRKT